MTRKSQNDKLRRNPHHKKAPKDRVDIKYCKTGGEHVVVELKRADRAVTTSELMAQTEKYRPQIRQRLSQKAGKDVEVQVVCVVGRDLKDWSEVGGREKSRMALEHYNTRVMLYPELVANATLAYQEYLDANREVGAIRDILHAMENQLTSPTGSPDQEPQPL